MTLGDWIKLGLANFSATMFLLAIIFIILHKLIVGRRVANAEIIYRWMAAFALGFTGVYAFIIHGFYPQLVAESIGWQPSPFQFEVATADLAIGVLGILSFRANYDFRLATVLGSLIMLWGDAAGHIYQQIIAQNFSEGNAGTWFWMDILIPLILLICLIKLRASQSRR